MKFGSILDDEPAFQFKSMFSYSRVPGSEEDLLTSMYNGSSKEPGIPEKITRSVLLAITYSAFLITLPVSIWFCIRKVNALERCVIFRLGKRLPLKGPGYVVAFPCLDVVDIINLNPQDFKVTENASCLTSDGSVIEIKSFDVVIAVSDAVKSFTQLKDSRSNVQQFIKLSFTNLIASTHVEDLERKIDWIMKDFILNCNNYITRWGWEIMSSSLPKFTIINRADPANPIMDALKSYFNPGGNSSDVSPTLLAATSNNASSESSVTSCQDPSVDKFIQPMQSVAGKFTSLRLLGRESVVLRLNILGEAPSFYKFSTNDGRIEKLSPEYEGSHFDVDIQAKTGHDFLTFIQTNDTNLVEISHTLF